MRKIIAIGESVLDTIFANNVPVKSFVGGRVANAASSLALSGLEVLMVSECGNDHVGDIIIDFLKRNRVDVTSVDRYVNGTTAFRLSLRATITSHSMSIMALIRKIGLMWFGLASMRTTLCFLVRFMQLRINRESVCLRFCSMPSTARR